MRGEKAQCCQVVIAGSIGYAAVLRQSRGVPCELVASSDGPVGTGNVVG